MSYIPSFYTTTTYTDLTNSNNSRQTTDGNYSLTNRPNTGDDILIVTVVDNAVSSGALVERKRQARGNVYVDDNTGRAGTFNVLVNGTAINSSPISFDGDVQSSQEIADVMATAIDTNGYTGFNIGGDNQYCYIVAPTSLGYGVNTSVISIETVSGDSLLDDGISQFSNNPFAKFINIINYDFANDKIYETLDSFQNKISSNVFYFPLNSSSNSQYIAENDFSVAGSPTDFTNFVGDIYGSTLENYGSIIASNGYAAVGQINIKGQSVLDLTAIKDGSAIQDIIIEGVGMNIYFNEAQSNIHISNLISNYQKDFTITANVLNFNETQYHNWAGILNVLATGELKTFSNLNKAPKYFKVAPKAGLVVTIDPMNVTNIILASGSGTITLDGDNGDFIEFMHNGTNAYQVNLCQF